MLLKGYLGILICLSLCAQFVIYSVHSSWIDVLPFLNWENGNTSIFNNKNNNGNFPGCSQKTFIT